jgi:4-methylaminobutanoate oxidase (formaldehyde-forming)
MDQAGALDIASGVSTRYLCRRARDELFVVADAAGAKAASMDTGVGVAPATDGIHAIDVSSAFAGLSLVGPRSPDVLSRLAQVDVSPSTLGDRRCVQCGLSRVNALIVRLDLRDRSSRALYAYDVFVGTDTARYVWDSIVAFSDDMGVVPIGMDARRRFYSSEGRPEGA